MNINTNQRIQIALVVIIVLLLGYLASTLMGNEAGAPEISNNEEETSLPSNIYLDEETGLLSVDSIRSSEIEINYVYKEDNGLDYALSNATKYNPLNDNISERTILNIVDDIDLSFGILPDGYKSGLIFEVDIANNSDSALTPDLENLFSIEQIDNMNINFDIFLYGFGDSVLESGETGKGYVAFAVPVDAVSINAMFGDSLVGLSFLEDTYQILD